MFNHKLKEGKRTLERESLDIQTGKEETRKEGQLEGKGGGRVRGERERERCRLCCVCLRERGSFLTRLSREAK